MDNQLDENGNGGADFETIVSQMVDVPATDGKEVNEAPVEDSTPKEEVVEEEVVDELDSILDDLTDDDAEEVAGDDQEKAEVTEDDSDEEPEEDDDSAYTVKIDGEEHTVSLTELKKGYGLQQSLTRKGQELAETKKKLDAEAEAISWAKAQPEARDLASKIQEAEEAIARGFVFDENGEQVRLNADQIKATQDNVAEARGKLSEMAKPPRLEDLQEAIPEMFDPEKAADTLKPFGDTLREFGYSEAEIVSQNDPRTFLILKELHEKRDFASRVEKAKARQKEQKPKIASKPAKGTPTGGPSKSKTGEAKPPINVNDMNEKILAGEASPADLFMD